MVHSLGYFEHRAHRAVEAQGRFARRIGDTVELPNASADGFDRWNVADVVHHDDHAPVVLQEQHGRRIMTIPALQLDRFESAARGHTPLVGAAEVISVEHIADEPDNGKRVEALVQRLNHWEQYAPAGVMASAFPEEMAIAARAAFE